MFVFIEEKLSKLVIEKSKFISYAFFCDSQNKKEDVLKKIKREHKSATHICFGKVFFDNSKINFCFSDDREPAGTAGGQILLALKENEMINSFIVVVRYFGGKKLGVAGLKKAYKEAALNVIFNNKKEVILKTRYKVSCDYNEFNKIKSLLQKNTLDFLNFNKSVTFEVDLSIEQYNDINKLNIKSLTKLRQNYC